MVKKKSKEIKDYRHSEKRKNIPDSGLLTYRQEKPQKKKYEYDPYLDPQLNWTGKAEHTSYEVDTVDLHVHERISTQAILESVKRKQGIQTTLNFFAEPDLPLDKRIEFYKHDVNWSNRMILGDSLIVMNSLLESGESLAGKVQMIYIDPPYGIGFDSNFQPFVNNKNVKDGNDESISREPEQIKAYRDTWVLDIHSYLTYLRDRLLLAKDLLHESGSCFVQISEKNVHHVREIMDEIFERKNFISQVIFRKKKMPLGASFLEYMCDYILYYAKNKEKVKYRQLFVPKDVQGDSKWCFVELKNGHRRRMTKEEHEDHSFLPDGSEVYYRKVLRPAGFNENATFPIKINGKVIYPQPGKSWNTSKENVQVLLEKKRLELSEDGKTLNYIVKLSDFPVSSLTSHWPDTSAPQSKLYTVQTSDEPIKRCMLMSTDPGDLVFDPTCGSGTTAYVAEKWGRRWITCDTSRVAITIARQRLLQAVFPYYTLKHLDEGVNSGFEYKIVSHLSMGDIANNKPPKTEDLYDQAEIDKSKIRVSGPFTIETISVPSAEYSQDLKSTVQNPVRPTNTAGDHITNMIEILKKTQTIQFPGGRQMELTNIRSETKSNFIHAIADSKDGKTKVTISFGPKHGPITVKQVEAAIASAQYGYNLLIMAGFAINDEAQAFIQKNPHPKVKLEYAHIQQDVFLSDLLKTPKGTQIFSVFGQPDVKITKKADQCTVELKGVDIYDPITGSTEQSSGDTVAAWFLDTDYDGYTFRISQAFFPSGATAKNPWDKLENALKGIVDVEKIEQFRTTKSLPFEAGKNKKIAVKVIDLRGNEVIAVREL